VPAPVPAPRFEAKYANVLDCDTNERPIVLLDERVVAGGTISQRDDVRVRFFK
jgi:hypothetical protein